MEFCKCGCILVEKEGKATCPRCGCKSSAKINLESTEKIKAKSEVFVVNEGDNEVNPVMDKECPKCKNNKAFFWMTQTRASDEAPTRFFKCTKCMNILREYR
jgi:transcription factor S